MKNVALLLLRLVTGSLMAGHGAQKLFGWFEGPGLQGTAGMLEKQGFPQPDRWARIAALSEFGGGVLTALGFLNPLGPMGIIGPMGIAITKAHWGKPIWVTKGGGELPLTNLGIATAVALAGPGKLSLDAALGVKTPRWAWIPGLALPAAGIVAALFMSHQEAEQQVAQEQPAQREQQPEKALVQPAPVKAVVNWAATPAPPERPAPVPAQPERSQVPAEPGESGEPVSLPEQPTQNSSM